MPHNIFGSGICRVDGPSTFMYCPLPGGDGVTTTEQFVPYRPDGTMALIDPGEDMYLKSSLTDKNCRMVVDAGLNKILCDQDTTATASLLEYTGRSVVSVAYQGRPFINPGNNGADSVLW